MCCVCCCQENTKPKKEGAPHARTHTCGMCEMYTRICGINVHRWWFTAIVKRNHAHENMEQQQVLFIWNSDFQELYASCFDWWLWCLFISVSISHAYLILFTNSETHSKRSNVSYHFVITPANHVFYLDSLFLLRWSHQNWFRICICNNHYGNDFVLLKNSNEFNESKRVTKKRITNKQNNALSLALCVCVLCLRRVCSTMYDEIETNSTQSIADDWYCWAFGDYYLNAILSCHCKSCIGILSVFPFLLFA